MEKCKVNVEWTEKAKFKDWLVPVDHGGVTLAQLVKASAGQADVQRFEPHLGHN